MTARLSRDRDTASRHLVRKVPVARADQTVAEMLAGLAGQEYEVADAVYVLDSANRLVGVVPFPRLLTCPNDRPLNEVMIPNPIGVQPEMDQEQVAVLAIQHRLNVVPVTDAASHFMGVIPASVLLGVLLGFCGRNIQRTSTVWPGCCETVCSYPPPWRPPPGGDWCAAYPGC